MKIIFVAACAMFLFEGAICDARCCCKRFRLFSGKCRVQVAPADPITTSPTPARLLGISDSGVRARIADLWFSDKGPITLIIVAEYDPFDTQPIGEKVFDCLFAEGILPWMFGSRGWHVGVHPADASRARELIDDLRQREDLDIAVLDEDGQVLPPGKTGVLEPGPPAPQNP